MRLHDLLHRAGLPATAGDAEIAGLSDDSRTVAPGDLFIARRGPGGDGGAFVRDALVAGAAAVVSICPLPDVAAPVVVTDDPRDALGRLAHAFYGEPTRDVRVAAVTGTNGKTTVAYLLRHLLAAAGVRCGLISTVEIDDGRSTREAEMTTPGAIELARTFAAMGDNGCSAVAIEASSHALDQRRLDQTRIHVAGFTNLTGDHLDYHKTMDEYAAAKAKLFDALGSNVGVVNAEDAWSDRVAAGHRGPTLRFGIDRDVGLDGYGATSVRASFDGTNFTLRSARGTLDVTMPLVGRHNVANALLASAMACEGFDVPLDAIGEALRTARGAPGRLERVANPSRPDVGIYVDYAHTDDALDNVLRALRPLTRGRLRVVFGCGGDRDATKRPRMARVAEKLADAVYVTSDNPRTEDPAAILDAIVGGFSHPPALVEADRRAAIARAIRDAGPGDVVLIAGKGHEKYQIVGRTKQPFDDVEEASRAS